MNVLWEMGGCERVLQACSKGAKGLIHGVTCGAGMPYRLAEICARYGVHYYPIVSSARAFNALWKRAYHKSADGWAAVVYEDPWLAGGHNGLSNVEDPTRPEPPLPARARDPQADARVGLGPRADRHGRRRLASRASGRTGSTTAISARSPSSSARGRCSPGEPDPGGWKRRLLELLPGDVLLHRFSPTGFYSSAVKNSFLGELVARSDRQVEFAKRRSRERLRELLRLWPSGRGVYVSAADLARVDGWSAEGYSQPMRTPDDTLIFVAPQKAREIRRDQANCMGCLSHCKFSNWKDHGDFTTGRPADPRSFCIQKTLQDIAHGHGDPVDNQLMFAGHNVYRFRQDPFYANGFVPSVKRAGAARPHGPLIRRRLDGAANLDQLGTVCAQSVAPRPYWATAEPHDDLTVLSPACASSRPRACARPGSAWRWPSCCSTRHPAM